MKRRGLTVVEGIIVVVVLAVVVAIFWPVFTVAGDMHTSGPTCFSKLRQLGTAMTIYAGDFDERLPDRNGWMDVIVPYHKNGSIEHCPGVAEESKNNPNLFGYAFDSRLSRTLATNIKEPAKAPMLYDSINLARNASDPFTSLPNPPRHPSPSNRPRQNNIGYLDGSVKAVTGGQQ